MAGNRVISAVLTLKDRDFGSTASKAAKSTKDFERRVKSTSNSVKRFGKDATSNLKSVAKGAVGMVAAYAGFNAVKGLGVSMVESAASAQAMSAQFESVFGNVETKAQSTVDELAKSFGMVSDRIKPGFTKVTSMFKGFGMTTEQSMSAATDAMKLSADAAAFYDVSMTDSEGAITSFLKGNTNAAESIGIFATAAGMADFASKELGQNWKKLDEGGKQLVRLKYVEKMQDAAGATGQAARESDGLENVLGNLKQSWETLKAKFGAPILKPAIKGMQFLSSSLEKVDTESFVKGFKKFGGIAKGAVEFVKPGIAWLKDNAIPGVKRAVELLGIGMLVVRDWAVEAFQNIKQRIQENKPAIEGVKGVMEDLGSKALEVKDWMLNAFESSKPALAWLKDEGLPLVVDGIAAVVEKATETYNYIKDNWSAISPVVYGVAGAVIFYKTAMGIATLATKGMALATVGMSIAQGAFNAVLAISPLGWVAIAIGAVIAVGVLLYKNWDTVKAAGQGLWDKLKEVWTGIQTGFSAAWNIVQSAAADSINGVIDKINGLIGVINKIPGVNIPIVAQVDWGQATAPQGMAGLKGIDSYAVGTNQVKRDMVANIHKGEMIIPAAQSRNLRKQGVTIDNVDRPARAKTSSNASTGNSFVININGSNKSTAEIMNELVPQLKLRLANI